jgi:hypothetical protein
MKNLTLFFLTFFFTGVLNAQQLYFTPALSIPLKDINGNQQQNAWAGGINFPLWSAIDLDGDGLRDLFKYDKSNDRISTFLNDGSQGQHAYHYAPEYISRFPKPRTSAWGLCYDYNCDGNADYFTLDSTHAGIQVWRNDFTVLGGLQFTKVSSTLFEDWSGPQPINIFASSVFIPAFSDIDNDGDMDILGFNMPPDGKFAYHKNLSMDLYGICDSLVFIFDDQCWGNFTMSIDSNAVSSFHNVPCLAPAPFDLIHNDPEYAKWMKSLSTLCALDIDGDGAKDLLIGDQHSPNVLMVHNGGTPQSSEMDSSDGSFPSYDMPVNVFNYVRNAYIDVDNDGKRDLLASAGMLEDKQGVWHYKNTGTDASPVFSFQETDFLQSEMFETGQAACPIFFDADGDGLQDILVAHGLHSASLIVSRMSYYKNTGTATAPSFQLVEEDYASLSNYNFPFPIAATFGDNDADGDMDMIIGDFAGHVHLMSNSAGAGNPASFALTAPQYMGIDVGNNAIPQLVDMDYDGALDLVIGTQTAMLKYFHNNGSPVSASFPSSPTVDTLGKILLSQVGAYSGYSVPYVFAYAGKHQMLTANMYGDIYYYEDIDNNLTGTFTRIDTVVSGGLGSRDSGFNLFVSGGDINNDSLVDMVVGLYSGGAMIYYGSNSLIGIDENEIGKSLACYPNPADRELHVGISAGTSRIEIYNVLGERVTVRHGHDISNRDVLIDISAFPSGIYIVASTDSKIIRRAKVIIQH